MPKRSSDSRWNPASLPQVTPKEYEQQVIAWLKPLGTELEDLEINHLEHLPGRNGDYEFDAVASFTIFSGARITVLIECKRYSSPVKRDVILALEAKRAEVGANKAIVFATCGFQRGALQYAREHGIATVIFADGKSLYETKAANGESHEPPPWVDLPRFAGIIVREEYGTIHYTRPDYDDSTVREWLNSQEEDDSRYRDPDDW
jgi:restriction system protein